MSTMAIKTKNRIQHGLFVLRTGVWRTLRLARVRTLACNGLLNRCTALVRASAIRRSAGQQLMVDQRRQDIASISINSLSAGGSRVSASCPHHTGHVLTKDGGTGVERRSGRAKGVGLKNLALLVRRPLSHTLWAEKARSQNFLTFQGAVHG